MPERAVSDSAVGVAPSFSFLAFLFLFLFLPSLASASAFTVTMGATASAPSTVKGIETESEVKSSSRVSSSSCCFTSSAKVGSFLSLGLKTGSFLSGLSCSVLKVGRFFSGIASPEKSSPPALKLGSFLFGGSAKVGSFLAGADVFSAGVGELTSPAFWFLI